jgi:hypothetical protein
MKPRWTRKTRFGWPVFCGLLLGLVVIGVDGKADAGPTSYVTVPVVAVIHYANAAQGEVIPAVSIQVERRGDQDALRLVLNHRPGMVDPSYPSILESAIRNGLAHLGHDSRGLTVTIGFAGPFHFFGGSLSAAVVIGTEAALQGRSLTPNLVLTGTVQADGSLGPIAELDVKIAGAGSYTVLYPSMQTTSVSRDIPSKPIHTLQEASLLMLQ